MTYKIGGVLNVPMDGINLLGTIFSILHHPNRFSKRHTLCR